MSSRVSLILFVACGLPMAASAADCAGLTKLNLPDTTIAAAVDMPAGDFTPPQGQPLKNLPAFCRVSGVMKPASDSVIPFEVWMPATGWNGKFQGIGNGGYAGSIGWGALALAISNGYAAAATDTGHTAEGTNATWALGHPHKIIDFGYRAIHKTAVEGKAVVTAFYGDAPKRAYFNSCSNGGRQALMEAERYPGDYHGIIAGAPAYHWTHLLSSSVWNAQALLAEAASYIPASKLPAIEAATLAACDSLDGVKDGVIDDPTRCHFDPSKLLCSGADSSSCLTAPQVAALAKIYSGPRNSKGVSVFPGYSVGGETGNGGWANWTVGAAPTKSLGYAFGTQFFINMVYENPAWDFKTFQVDRDMNAADEKLAKVLNATDADLRPFQARGGKLILYHGWSDAAIPPVETIEYYKAVTEKLGPKAVDAFVRLYMVPGMQHCGGGPGPNSFGTGSVAVGDAQHDVARALEHWVEDGVAPDQIIAAKKSGGNVVRTRPLCPYPQTAHWKGTGSTDDAANFTCSK